MENVRILLDALDQEVVAELADDLHRHPRIGAFGAMHMENTSRSLQSDLFRCRKIVNIRSRPPRQVDYLRAAID